MGGRGGLVIEEEIIRRAGHGVNRGGGGEETVGDGEGVISNLPRT